MKLLVYLALTFALLVATALANAEKVIFLAPQSVELPHAQPGLEALHLKTLTHEAPSLRTSIDVAFPSEEEPRGLDHWFLLRSLDEYQRYELRLCWAATQPTEFWLNVYSVSEVFDTPHMIQSLARYSEQSIKQLGNTSSVVNVDAAHSQSVLFLRVSAAADYFTTNKTLMLEPSPVDIDLILDPYIGGLFPLSLGPTAVYIIVVAAAAWLISNFCWKYLDAGSSKLHAE